MIIGTTVLNWYESDFTDSVALIESFVSLMENQVEDAIHKYKTERHTEMIEEDLGTTRERRVGQSKRTVVWKA